MNSLRKLEAHFLAHHQRCRLAHFVAFLSANMAPSLEINWGYCWGVDRVIQLIYQTGGVMGNRSSQRSIVLLLACDFVYSHLPPFGTVKLKMVLKAIQHLFYTILRRQNLHYMLKDSS